MPRVIPSSQSQSYLVGQSASSPDQAPSRTVSLHQANNVPSVPVPPRVPPPRKPSKSTSFSIPRVESAPIDGETIMARRPQQLSSPTTTPPRGGVKRTTSSFRAAEKGKGDLLPTATRSIHPPNRVRSMSHTTTASTHWNAKPPTRVESFVSRTLRSRGKRATTPNRANGCEDRIDSYSQHMRPSSSQWSYSHDKPHAVAYSGSKNTNFLQMFAALIVTCLVWESYRRALATTEQFAQLRHDESLILLHLRKLEQSSIHLHEQLTRLNDGTMLQVKDAPADIENGNSKDDQPIDADLIRVQTRQLSQMEDELHHELRGLQGKLQQSARRSIVQAFGEGPIQIAFDIDLGDSQANERIAISLWYDTPYAAWTFIELARNNQWTGAKFSLDRGLSISATPENPIEDATLDFVEDGQEKHEAWTVGLADLEEGGIRFFINVQDNSATNKRHVCVGKVIEGFGTLQKLIASTRKLDGTDRAITITSAVPSRIPKGKSGMFQ